MPAAYVSQIATLCLTTAQQSCCCVDHILMMYSEILSIRHSMTALHPMDSMQLKS